MIQLLLFEYLHADPTAFRQAPPSMRSEGRAMLNALLEDAVSLADCQVSVVLCDAALTELIHPATNIAVTPCGAHDDPLEVLSRVAATADLVLPIAPESDSLLQKVSMVLQDTTATVLLPPPPVVDICSDKLLTFQELHRRGIPMADCHAVERAGEETTLLRSDLVFKPRFGAGCDGIRRGGLPSGADPDDYLQQPWMSGRSLSVAVLGGPHGWRQLPAAEQIIEWTDNEPRYTGGIVPADVSTSTEDQIRAIVESVVEWAGDFRGYLGLDLLLSDVDDTVCLNEINPRICTSYIGYRQVLTVSPLGVLTRGVNPLLRDPAHRVHFVP